jgi:long-chain acyl-CoA synthetase
MTLLAEYSIPAALREWAERAEVRTLPEAFRRSVARVGSRPYLGQKVDGVYRFQTYGEVQVKVHQLACALIELGLKPGDRVANFSNNRPEWPITDLGTVHAACVHVPMYSTLNPSDLSYILRDSGARVVIAATPEHLRKVLAIEKECPHLEHVVAIEQAEGSCSKRLWSWQELLELGASRLSEREPEMERRLAELRAWDVCSLVYTSGTTGHPKGAMLMHGNFVSNASTLLPWVRVTCEDVELSFLPLSHVFERIAYYVMTLAGGTIGYASSIETVAEDFLHLRPTLVPSVPRLFEKIYVRIFQQAQGLRGAILRWAVGVGKASREAALSGPLPLGLRAKKALAHKLVFARIHAGTGGRVRCFFSGGASLRRDVGEFFLNAGFTIAEGYGLTESSPVLTVNPLDEPRIGTVGKVLPGVEVRIADDGEILARGPNIMLGYFNMPEVTAEALEPDGWFHTGDVGRFDADDYLVITDRKKELLVLSNGKNVAPQPIEQQIKASPWIEQVVVVGDGRNFVAALVVPAFARLEEWAGQQGLPLERAALVREPRVYDQLFAEVQSACQDFSNYEKVKKIAVLSRELTMDQGELTPTLKVKRHVVDKHFRQEIEGLYS